MRHAPVRVNLHQMTWARLLGLFAVVWGAGGGQIGLDCLISHTCAPPLRSVTRRKAPSGLNSWADMPWVASLATTRSEASSLTKSSPPESSHLAYLCMSESNAIRCENRQLRDRRISTRAMQAMASFRK